MERIERYSTLGEVFEKQRVPLGMMTGSTDPAIIEIVGNSGFDFVILDNEHSPIEPELAGHLIRAAETSCVLPLVRVIQNDPYLISKMVDAGARGVVVPHINTADDVRKAVAALRFAPDGPRGWCPSAHTAKYSVAYWSRHSEGVSAGTSIIPLIESREAVKNIDEILAVPGVEIVLFGPGDLSHEMGVHLEGLRSAELQQAVEKVISAAKKANTKVIGFPFPEMTKVSAQSSLDMGFNAICYGLDLLLFTDLCLDIAGSFDHPPRW